LKLSIVAVPFLPEVGQRVLPIIDSLPDGNQICISDNDPAGKATFLEQRRIIEGIVDTLKKYREATSG